MLVVGKLDYELPLVFRFRLLIRRLWFTKREPRFSARRGFHMADRADRGTRSDHRLFREELLPMAADTGIVIWKVSNVGKISLCSRRGRNLVTFVARQGFMFFRRVKKS